MTSEEQRRTVQPARGKTEAGSERNSGPSGVTVYVAGPMAGHPDLNRAAFDHAVRVLSVDGLRVVIPHDIPPIEHEGECPAAEEYPGADGGGHGGMCHLRADLRVMLTCNLVVMLSGWERSRGARAERATAEAVAMPVVFLLPGAEPYDESAVGERWPW